MSTDIAGHEGVGHVIKRKLLTALDIAQRLKLEQSVATYLKSC